MKARWDDGGLAAMSHEAIAQALGLSRMTVIAIERTALRKVAAAFGADASRFAPEPASAPRGPRKRCGNCGALGHNRATCVGAP